MANKLAFLAGVGVGYVLGARAGRTRYEQIKTKSQELWQSEPVQTKVTEATEVVKAKAPVVTEKVTEAAKHAGEAAKSKVSSTGSPDGEGDTTSGAHTSRRTAGTTTS